MRRCRWLSCCCRRILSWILLLGLRGIPLMRILLNRLLWVWGFRILLRSMLVGRFWNLRIVLNDGLIVRMRLVFIGLMNRLLRYRIGRLRRLVVVCRLLIGLRLRLRLMLILAALLVRGVIRRRWLCVIIRKLLRRLPGNRARGILVGLLRLILLIRRLN